MNDYTKYSLKQLDEWVYDALNNEELTPLDIYEQINQTVREHVEYHTKNANKGTSLLNLFSSGSSHSTSFPPYNWNYEIPTELSSQDIWDDEKSAEELRKWYDENVMPSATQRDIDREALEEYDVRESEYYNHDRVTKWVLPVQQVIEEGIDNYFINLPDDLLDTVQWRRGDALEWIANDDGSYTLQKVS